MKKARRIATFLMALVLIIGLLPSETLTVRAASAGGVTEVGSFNDLMAALEANNVATIRLTKDINVEEKFPEGEFPKQVNGTKVLDLNGHDVTIKDNAQYGDKYVYEETLFKINGDLTVEDSSGKDSLINFNAYAYSQAKTTSFLDGGEYEKKDERDVFEVMDGGKLVINGGTIQAGRCKTQWIIGGQKRGDYSQDVGYTGNATFVISGSAVIMHAGSTFIMNGGELNGRGVPLIHTDFESTGGKQTVLHLNDGYFYGKAGASILTGYSMEKLIGNEDEAFDLQIRGGVFETDKEEYEREIDKYPTGMAVGFSDSVVSKGYKGNLNIPESCVVGMYRNKRTKDTADRYDNLVNGKTYNHFELPEDQLESVENGIYLLKDMKLTVRPKAGVTLGDIAYSKEKQFGAFCVDEEVTLSYEGYVPLWPVEEVGNVTDGIDSPVSHAISYEWKFSKDGKTYEIYTAEPALELGRLKELKADLYNEMVTGKERWDITFSVNEYYQGRHSYKAKTSSKETNLAFRDHNFKNTGVNTAGCTYNGTQEQTCYFCGVTRTVTTEPLGHIFDETNWYPFDVTEHAHVCKRCGEAVGGSLEYHNFAVVPNSTVVANCQHAGTHEEYCTVCGYRKTIVDSAKLEHDYKNTGYATDYEKNGNGHWKVCLRCHEAGPMEAHVDGNGDGVCDKCGTAIPVIFVSTVGQVAPSFHATLEVSGEQKIDMEELKRLCKIYYDLNTSGGSMQACRRAAKNVNNYVADYEAWLDATDTNSPKVMKEYFEQMVVDLETNYDEAVEAGYGLTTSYNWSFSQDSNFSTSYSINDNSATTAFGREKTLDLSIRPNGYYSYDYAKTTYFRCRVTTSIKCSTTVTNPKLVNAGYQKNNMLFSTVITVPAMTKADGKSATCTESAISEAYVCPDCNGLYAIMKNGTDVTVTCADGTVRKQLVPITEADRVNPNYPARGHYFNPACGSVCVSCNKVVAGDRHEAANNEWVKVDDETHAHVCKYCNEAVANVTYHNFELVTVVPGSCNEEGTYKYVCKDCGYAQPEFKDSELGHDWQLQEGSVEPGCTTAGALKYKCSNCNTEKTVTVAPLGHQLEELDFVAQNCSENGRKHVWHCAYCDLYFSDAEGSVQIAESEVIIPADGVSHVWGTEWVYGKNAHWHECELCDAVKDVTEDAKPADVDAVATNLDGKVGLLFYVTMPDYVLADEGAYATLTLNTKNGDVTETQLVKNAPYSPKGSLDRWQFSYYVVAKQMHDKVTLNLYLSDGTRVPLTRKGEAVAGLP